MKKAFYPALCMVVLLISACEVPKSPNFKLEHNIEAPLSVKKTYPFLGAGGALIDTTKGDLGDIFSANKDGLVRIAKEEKLSFVDLSNAMPNVAVTPTTVHSPVGVIKLTNLNSSGKVGSAGFQDITGFSSPSQGQTITAGSGSVNIDFTTEYFQSAVIKENGGLELTLTNNLGFDIDELQVKLNSGSNFVGQTTIGTEGSSSDNFPHGTQKTGIIPVPASTNLENLNTDLTVKWNEQQMEQEGNNLVINSASGKELVASQFTGAPQSQTLQNTGTSAVDESSFEFRTTEDFVELGSGTMVIDITNNIDLGIDTLDIRFEDIIDQSGVPLVVELTGIPRSSNQGDSYSATVDLTGHKIKAENGIINLLTDALTENVQQGFDSSTDSYRVINETDAIDAQISLNNLNVSRASGYIVPKRLLLNDDATNDGVENLDVFNDKEAEIINIDGISDITSKISNITFANPELRTLYETNIGVNTMIYAVIAGRNSSGETVYLKGLDNSKYDVQSSEVPSELTINGESPSAEQVIKFRVDTAESPSAKQGEKGSNIFTSSNTNSSEFFSSLPTEIRFIGTAAINKKRRSGVVVSPVIFKPTMSIELPLEFSVDNTTYKDTVNADLSSLPGDGDDSKIDAATLTLNYTNGLPINIDLNIRMIGKNGNILITKDGISVEAASVNGNGFVEEGGAAENQTKISFSKSELKDLNKIRDLKLEAILNSPTEQAVNIRAKDSVTFRINLKAKLTSTVN